MTLFVFVINKDFVRRYFESINVPFLPKLFGSFIYLFLSLWPPIFQFYSVGYNLLLSLFWGSNHPQFGQGETSNLCFWHTPLILWTLPLLLGPKDAPGSILYFPWSSSRISHFLPAVLGLSMVLRGQDLSFKFSHCYCEVFSPKPFCGHC